MTGTPPPHVGGDNDSLYNIVTLLTSIDTHLNSVDANIATLLAVIQAVKLQTDYIQDCDSHLNNIDTKVNSGILNVNACSYGSGVS